MPGGDLEPLGSPRASAAIAPHQWRLQAAGVESDRVAQRATACVTVGDYPGSTVNSYVPLAETWNGASWSTQSTPVPYGAANTILRGVSCTRTTACKAAGSYDYLTVLGPYLTLAENYTG